MAPTPILLGSGVCRWCVRADSGSRAASFRVCCACRMLGRGGVASMMPVRCSPGVIDGQGGHHGGHPISLRADQQLGAACRPQAVIIRRKWPLCRSDMGAIDPPTAPLRGPHPASLPFAPSARAARPASVMRYTPA
jgi:hypothetical protein